MQDEYNDAHECLSHVPSARERHPEIFRPLDEMIDSVEKWAHACIELPDDVVGNVKIAITVRALNILKCVKILMENDHWEDAGILTRSLFELLLNLEEILRVPAQCEHKAVRFVRFGYLQRYLNMKANVDYEIARGTYNENVHPLKKLESLAPEVFPEFLERQKHTSKKPKWVHTWCGKTVKELAETSPNAMRLHQYSILYSFTSNLVHSSPVALTGSTNLLALSEITIGDTLRMQEVRMVEFITMAIIFSQEILTRTGDVLPKYDPHALYSIMKTTFGLLGVNPPTP